MTPRQAAQVRKLLKLNWSTRDICTVSGATPGEVTHIRRTPREHPITEAENLARHGRRMLACCPKGVSPEAHRRLVERVFGPLGAT